MALMHKLGEYIEKLNRPNTDLRYGIDDVAGITNTKEITVGTKANLIGRTFEKFTVLKPGEFIFNRRTSRNGERISLGYNQSDRDWILTEDYCHFRVRDDKKDELDSDYLYLYFLRPEFDRYARFNSWGSATEFFNWEEMVKVPIPVPDIDVQRKIVHDYKVVKDRIELLKKINENLEGQARAVYKDTITDGMQDTNSLPDGWRKVQFETIANVTRGASPRPIDEYMSESGMPWVKISDATGSISKYLLETKEFIISDGVKKSRLVEPGTLIVSNSASPGLPMITRITACVHDGWLIISDYNEISQEYLYYYFLDMRQKLIAASNGSVFNNLKTDIVKSQDIVVPDKLTLDRLTSIFKAYNAVIENNAYEIASLMSIQSALMNSMGKEV